MLERQPIPIDSLGLIIPPEREACMQDDCRLFPDCRIDNHHLYFPRVAYVGLAKQFRDLPHNQVSLCRSQHVEYHASFDPPIMPEPEVMYDELWSYYRRAGMSHKQAKKKLC